MSDLLSAATLLLTVVGVIYSLWYAEISSAINEGPKLPPRDHREDRRIPLKKLREVLHSKAVPLSVASLLVAIVFFPPSMSLAIRFARGCIQQGPSILSRYDAIATSFFTVEMFSLALAYFSLTRAVQLWKLTRD